MVINGKFGDVQITEVQQYEVDNCLFEVVADQPSKVTIPAHFRAELVATGYTAPGCEDCKTPLDALTHLYQEIAARAALRDINQA